MELIQSKSRYILTFLAIILVITAFILIALKALHLESIIGIQSPSEIALKQKYIEGYRDARTKLQSMCPMIGLEQRNINGIITKISNTSITISTNTIDSDPALKFNSNRIVIITDSTSIELHTQKSDTEFMDDLTEFSKIQKPESRSPSLFNISKLTLRDLHVGETINIQTLEDARVTEQLTAISIIKAGK